jgi:hypothetical protein
MRRSILLSIVFAAGLPGILDAGPAPDSPFVGSLGSTALIDLVGAPDVPIAAFRQALTDDIDIQASSGAKWMRDAYLTTIRDRVTAGFKRAGYPDPKVTTAVVNGRVVVTVDRGARCTKAVVEFVGNTRMPVAEIVRKMTTGGSGYTFDVDFKDGGVDVGCDMVPANVSPTVDPAESLGFDAESASEWRHVASYGIAAAGYFRPNFEVSAIVRGDTSVMRIAVADDGPVATLGHLEITGNVRSDAKSIVECTGLRPGDKITVDALLKAQQRLYDSGRFLSHHFQFAPTSDGPVVLELSVIESAAPPLSQPLSEADLAILKFAGWMEEAFTHSDGVAFEGFYRNGWNVMPIHAAVSGRDGMACAFGPAAAMMTTRQAGLVFYPFDFRATARVAGLRLTSTILLVPDTSPTAHADHIQIKVGGVLNLDDAADGATRPGTPRAATTVRVAPAAAIQIICAENSTATISNGFLLADSRGIRLVISEKTGQLRAVCYGAGPNFALVLLAESPAAVADLTGRILRAGPGVSQIDERAPISSAVSAMVSGTAVASLIVQQTDPEVSRRGIAALEKVVTPDLFSALDDALVSTSSLWAHFRLTPSHADLPPSVVRSVAIYGLPFMERLFSPGTWPKKVGRAVFLALVNRQVAADYELQSIGEDPTTGPLAAWCTAAAIRPANVRVSAAFATLGHTRLTRAAFVDDCHALMSPGSGLRTILDKAADNLRHLTPAEVDDLTAILPPAYRTPFRSVVDELRNSPGRPTDDVLVDFAGIAWDAGLSDVIAKSLEDLQRAP